MFAGCVQVCPLFENLQAVNPSVTSLQNCTETLATIIEAQAVFDLQVKACHENARQKRDCIKIAFRNMKAELEAAERQMTVAFDGKIQTISKIMQAHKDALDVWGQQLPVSAKLQSMPLELNLEPWTSVPMLGADSIIEGLNEVSYLVSNTLSFVGTSINQAKDLDALAAFLQDSAKALTEKSTEVQAKAAFLVTNAPREHLKGTCIFSASINVDKNDGDLSPLTCVAASQDGSILAVACRKYIALVSLESAKVIGYIDQGYMQHRNGQIQSLCVSHRGDSVFLDDDFEKKICICEVAFSGNVLKKMYGEPFAGIGHPNVNVLTCDISCSADVVVARVYKFFEDVDGVICVYDVQTGNLLRSFGRIDRGCKLALSKDGQSIVLVQSRFVVVFTLMGEIRSNYTHGYSEWARFLVCVPHSGDIVARYQSDGWVQTIPTDGSTPKMFHVDKLRDVAPTDLVAMRNGFVIVKLSTYGHSVAIDIVV